PKLSVLSQDNYQEKLATIEKMVGLHMREWRAHQVLAWLEISLAMPMYAQSCLTNVKSGKVVSSTMRSVVLTTINRPQSRVSSTKRFVASEMDPTWVSHRLLPDLGLTQHSQVFEEQLCDGHVLNTLTRRDLEKHFAVHRKFHQSSILHAVELLRRIDFNKEKLYHRRNLSEDKDTDLIVWTNDRLLKWLRSIDLGEYSESLLESGVHGALMVLEPSFNTDSLAAILGIPPAKSYITRHLSTELDKILKPARAALDPCDHLEKSADVAARGKGAFTSSVKGGSKSSQDKEPKPHAQPEADKPEERRKSQEEGRSRLSFRGSIGRAFGKKAGGELRLSTRSSKPRISAPVPLVVSPDMISTGDPGASGLLRALLAGSIGRAFGKKAGGELRLSTRSSKPRISAPVPLVVSPDMISTGDPGASGLLRKGFCVKEPRGFQRTRSLVINIDSSGRVVGRTGGGATDAGSRRGLGADTDLGHVKLKRQMSCKDAVSTRHIDSVSASSSKHDSVSASSSKHDSVSASSSKHDSMSAGSSKQDPVSASSSKHDSVSASSSKHDSVSASSSKHDSVSASSSKHDSVSAGSSKQDPVSASSSKHDSVSASMGITSTNGSDGEVAASVTVVPPLKAEHGIPIRSSHNVGNGTLKHSPTSAAKTSSKSSNAAGSGNVPTGSGEEHKTSRVTSSLHQGKIPQPSKQATVNPPCTTKVERSNAEMKELGKTAPHQNLVSLNEDMKTNKNINLNLASSHNKQTPQVCSVVKRYASDTVTPKKAETMLTCDHRPNDLKKDFSKQKESINNPQDRKDVARFSTQEPSLADDEGVLRVWQMHNRDGTLAHPSEDSMKIEDQAHMI
ncbi:hypothetical protein EGW08_018290, partial [Elysia chlorotica]